jgi:ketosteroid isomerase-like protein
MAQGFPIVSSATDILAWYQNCFKLITLDVVFEIKEVVVVSDEYAFATTTSAGTQKDNASGEVVNEGNHELFVIQKVDGEWKLARYCFSTTNRP